MSMRIKPACFGAWILLVACSASIVLAEEGKVRRISVREYRDKMKAGWIGQIIGVSWGAPTEGRYRQIMPEKEMPPFRDTLVNDAFDQDDLYVEMTFLRSLEEFGWDVSIRQTGIDFANSGYPLWVANDAGRRNLRNGIAPPDSSHPRFHNCAGAIDYQIEADYAGLICPGLPNRVIALGEKFGRLMNYGDGVYAGQFMGAMYAEAFFETDVHKIIDAALQSIPQESLYAEMVRDLLRWHRENPNDWEKTWGLVDQKYRGRDYYISALDVKLEGAFVLMGLLYGQGDLDKTIIISCRCGSDSDCNPSSSGGVLFTTRGVSKLPDRYFRKLDEKRIFNHTAYNFPRLLDVCEKLARQAVLNSGGRVEKDADGQESFVVPVETPRPSPFEDLRKPGPIAESRFSDEEMARIKTPGAVWAFPKLLAGWRASGYDMGRSYMNREWQDRENVFALFASEKAAKGWSLAKDRQTASPRKTTLKLSASADKGEGWELSIKADGKEVLRQTVKDGWSTIEIELSAATSVELSGKPKGKYNGPCYLADIALAAAP